MSDLEIEFIAFRDYRLFDGATGLPKHEHLWNIVSALWPSGSSNPVERNPWTERNFEALCKHEYLAISGCSGSTKTNSCAVYAIVCWLADPVGTSVMVSSTTLKESRRRIWGAIEDHWHALDPAVREIGHLASYDGIIRCNPKVVAASNISSIQLIPGEKRKEKDATGKIRGTHNKFVLLILDELTELSPAMVEAGLTNLRQNPRCQVVGVGNPSSLYDAHGHFSKPKAGWDSVTVEDMEWETKYGWHIRFDARKSPNILSGKVIYPYLPTQEDLTKAAEDLGPDSTGFWQMWVGFWPPEAESTFVYSPSEIVHYKADRTDIRWVAPPSALCALDPGYTNGGDRSVAHFAELGEDAETGLTVLRYAGWTRIDDDVRDRKTPRNFQIVRKWRDECQKRGITPFAACYDRTGGVAFGDIVAAEWSPEVLGVMFSGKASTRKSGADKAPASEKFANRCTELWYALREFMRCGQIRGIDDSFASELTSRRFLTSKTSYGTGIQIEPKLNMKSRTGRSPDVADSGLMLLELARQRYKFRATGSRSARPPSSRYQEPLVEIGDGMVSVDGSFRSEKRGARLVRSRAASVKRRAFLPERRRVRTPGSRALGIFR